jgi:ABC-type lipoprotein export system ATPase subunit
MMKDGDDMEETPILEARSITKHYEDGRIQALQGVDLTVMKGEMVAIMGPSGSGKSTLLHLMGALDIPSSGDVFINGHSITQLQDLEEFRSKQIGFIFQAFYLIPTLSALENVQIPMMETIPRAKDRMKKAERLLDEVGLKERIDNLPNQLSGGERQRVAIARSMANDPPILLADEPTGNLDTKNAANILSLIKNINKDRNATVVMVTHDPNVANMANRIVNILDGKVVGGRRKSD